MRSMCCSLWIKHMRYAKSPHNCLFTWPLWVQSGDCSSCRRFLYNFCYIYPLYRIRNGYRGAFKLLVSSCGRTRSRRSILIWGNVSLNVLIKERKFIISLSLPKTTLLGWVTNLIPCMYHCTLKFIVNLEVLCARILTGITECLYFQQDSLKGAYVRTWLNLEVILHTNIILDIWAYFVFITRIYKLAYKRVWLIDFNFSVIKFLYTFLIPTPVVDTHIDMLSLIVFMNITITFTLNTFILPW